MVVRKNFALNPLVIVLGTWGTCYLLHALQLSTRLNDRAALDVLIGVILVSFALGCLVSLPATGYAPGRLTLETSRRTGMAKNLLMGTALLALLEVVLEGFIPLISLLQGQRVSHFDFGIASVHGLVIAAFQALGTYFFVLYLATGKRTYLWLALIPVFYAILFMTRKMMTVCIMQYLIVFMVVRQPRLATMFRVFLVLLLFIFMFGLLGDVRGSTASIENYGGMGDTFDFWGASGFAWVYLYVTTPLDNVAFTITYFEPEANPFFNRTLGGLVPSVIANIFVESSGADRFAAAAQARYWLQSEVFNVSSGFNSPYLDHGWAGIVTYAGFLGFACMLSFLRMREAVMLSAFAAFMTASLLSVFSNNLGNLNFMGQFAIFLVLGLTRAHLPEAPERARQPIATLPDSRPGPHAAE